MKYTIFLIIFFILLISASCGRGEEEQTPDPTHAPALISGGFDTDAYESSEETVSVRLLVPAPEAGMYGDALADMLASRFHLDITLIPYPQSYDELMDVLISAGEVPDMFLLALTPARLNRLVTEGIIRGIPDGMLDTFPRLGLIAEQNPIARAYREIYGAAAYIPCVHDTDPVYAAESTRFLYRKDWAEILSLTAFSTAEDIYRAARIFAGETNPNRADDAALIGLAVDKPVRFAYMFGIDPAGWVLENGRYIPAYYSERMRAPLAFARRLREEGLLVFNDGGITLNDAGIITANVPDSVALERVLAPVARTLRIPAADALEYHVGIMEPPFAAGVSPAWGAAYRTEGWLAREGLDDGVLYRFLELLDYTLSPEGRAFARYGVYNETYARSGGSVFLFTDPLTYRAYDMDRLYPAGQFLLGLLTRDASRDADLFLPSAVPPAIRVLARDAASRYYYPFSHGDALRRAVHAPARDALEIDYNAYFYNIITGEEPVEVMFERYRDECIRHGIENAIEEVNGAL
jgi:hypothetical protein